MGALFTEKLSTMQVQVYPSRLWVLLNGFRYYSGYRGSEYYFDMNEGFVFDGGSIPRAAWFVDAPAGDGAQAYCLHDALYKSHLVTRLEADRLMLEGLKELGLNWVRRSVIYRAVRMFGWLAWRRSDPEIASARLYIKMTDKR